MDEERRRFLFLSGAFLAQLLVGGCAFNPNSPFVEDKGIYKKGEKPYDSTGDVLISEDIHDYPEAWEIINDKIPIRPYGYPRARVGANPVSPISKNTIAKVQRDLASTGQTLFINKEPITVRMGDRRNKIGIYTLPPGYIFFAEDRGHDALGNDIMQLTRLAKCYNPIYDVSVRKIPRTIVIERYYRNTERYLDERVYVDHGEAWAMALAGLFIGGVIGWLLHTSHAASTIVPVLSKCGKGAPAPR
jgi:hypothetical protein